LLNKYTVVIISVTIYSWKQELVYSHVKLTAVAISIHSTLLLLAGIMFYWKEGTEVWWFRG